ncbi:MAG: aspartyl/glutamyl-tRNA amidotransferase subunit A [Treponema sp.]|jgi:aspartyl-tRNA(Asn)/glutamyl-tRNA(Gln) amidotransferase subunit A|nr:aspartyl/glutamyl-tRNA amidotransferase subunit A [Treponema sp.]
MTTTLAAGWKEYAEEWEARIGAFTEFAPAGTAPSNKAAAAADGKSPLAGLPFAVKDNIAVRGFRLTCASKLLAGLESPYTATAVQKIIAHGAFPVGKTNLDEFGMGSSTDNSGIKVTNNPWDTVRVPGGSSGGSAAAVAAGIVPFALGSDTGGSIRQPAAFCGVVGLKPTYGAVSRCGLVAYASSLEGIGVLADSVERCRAVFQAMRGADPMDQTSHEAPAGAAATRESAGKGVIGVLSPEAVAAAVASAARGSGAGADASALAEAAEAAQLEPEVREGFEKAKAGLAELGYTLREVQVPSLKYGVPAYYTIATAEASANLARFDGVRYGKRPDWAENPDELVDKAREAGFGPEVKLRILLGAFVLRSGFQDRFYLRAQRIRAGIRASFEALLGDADYTDSAPPPCAAILLPVFPTRAFGRGPSALSPFMQKAADLYTCCANLAGLPALSFPASVEGGLPVGVQLLGRAFAEERLLDIAAAYTARCPIEHPAGWKGFWQS